MLIVSPPSADPEHRLKAAARAPRPSRCAYGTRRVSWRRWCAARRAPSIGLSMLTRSMDPSAAPAPTTVWSSSMKSTTWPSASVTSSAPPSAALRTSPRLLSRLRRARHVQSDDGFVLQAFGDVAADDALARPSTMAVLPTRGSPIRTGLFFVRRERTWMTRRISSSRPMTGSSLPARASAVRSRP